MRKTHHLFVAMYFELEYAFQAQKLKGEALRHFLGDSNPFVWSGIGSADPAIWIEFERAFARRFPEGAPSDADTLEFVRGYLSKQGPYYIRVFPGGDETSFLALFDAETNLAEWTSMLDDLEEQDREREG